MQLGFPCGSRSLHFLSDASMDGHRFRILPVVDDFIRNELDGFARISHGNCREEQRSVSALQSDAGYVARIVAFTQRQSQAFKLGPIEALPNTRPAGAGIFRG